MLSAEIVSDIEKKVRGWVTEIVVGLNLCPFAAPVLKGERLRIVVLTGGDEVAVRHTLHSELKRLTDADSASQVTTLVVLADGWLDFEDYLGLAEQMEVDLVQGGWEGVFQIATFHPSYRFADSPADDLGNFTNRAPYPLFHLIREDDVSRAVDTYPDVDGIPGRNVELLRRLGAVELRRRLEPFLDVRFLP